MTIADSIERYTGAYATPDLVGRVDALGKIDQALEHPPQQPQVIFLFGDGGVGKTRILQESRARVSQNASLIIGDGLIDLYDVQYHSSSGLAEAIWHMLSTASLRNYERERRRLLQLQGSGAIDQIAAQRAKMLDAFTEDMKVLADKRRIVLLLDTAERLVYSTEQDTDSDLEIAEAWIWLANSLPQWGNVTVLVASRPSVKLPTVEPLRMLLDKARRIDVHSIDVGAFTEQESLEYFDAVAQVARDAHDERVAVLVSSLTRELRLQVHQYARGRPVLMALLVDLSSVIGLAAITSALAEQEALGATDPQAPRNKLEDLLISRLQLSPRLRKTVVALGRAPKGVDASLLSRMLNESIEEAETRLNEVKKLSFTKARDQHVFLHDEMYAILSRQIYSAPEDAADAKQPTEAILDYYEDLFERNRQEITKIYESAEANRRELDKVNLAELINQRRVLLTDYLYYRLRQDAIRGFQYFFRFTFDAIHSGDIPLDVQLQAEIMAFLREQDPEGKEAFVDGLERAMVRGIGIIRVVARAWAENDHKRALELAKEIRRHKTRLVTAGDRTTEAALSIWEARSLIYLGGEEKAKQAREKLDRVIQFLQDVTRHPDPETVRSEARLWRAQALLALAFEVRAYLLRISGFPQEAVADYRQSIPLWRQVREPINLAMALNNMGFAMAELGNLRDARALVLEALDLRHKSGPRTNVGLSINTLAQIDLREGWYRSAMDNAERALQIFRVLENPRGQGLALNALAESQRRYCGEAPLSTDERIRLLRESREYAIEALEIFEPMGETVRQVESLIEQGCACRDLARIQHDYPNPRINLARLIDESKQALEAAGERAGETVYHRKVDALVNLVFLAFYSGRVAEIEPAARRAMDAIPAGYYINPKTGRPDIQAEKAQVLLWPQLAKLHMLRGHETFEHVSRTGVLSEDERQTYLITMARNYTLSMEYNKLYSLDHPGMRRALEQIYSNMKLLGFDDIPTVVTTVRNIEEEFHLRESEMRKLLRNRALWPIE